MTNEGVANMNKLIERVHCPYCGTAIIREYDENNRLFGNTITCESHSCKKEFIPSCAQVYERGSEPEVSVREIIRDKTKTEKLEDEQQTTLDMYV